MRIRQHGLVMVVLALCGSYLPAVASAQDVGTPGPAAQRAGAGLVWPDSHDVANRPAFVIPDTPEVQPQERPGAAEPADATQQKPTPRDPTAPPAGGRRSPDDAKPTRGFFSSLVHNLGDDVKHIPRRNSLYWLAAGSALALAVHPADDNLNGRLGGSDIAGTLFKPGKYIGSTPVVLGGSLVTFLVGRHSGSTRVQHFGMDLIEATLLSEGITQLIKYTVRRERPIAPDGSQASGYSFPSGHATVTFAVATVLQQHLGWKAAVPTYLIASYVAMSRMHDQRHFASDVVFGATDGIIIGRSVTWHGRNFYGSPMLVPHGAGVSFAAAW